MLDYYNQEEVTKFLNKIETDYDVENWLLDDIEIWPFIKISLYFYISGKKKNKDLISINSSTQSKKSASLTEILKKKVFTYTHPLKFKKFLNTLEKKDIVFYSHETYRTKYKGKNFNKFFDPLIIQADIANLDNAYFIEDFYNFSIESLQHSSIILDVRMPFNYFLNTIDKGNKHTLIGEDYDNFINSLDDKIFQDFKKEFRKDTVFEFFKTIYYKSIFFEQILKKIAPKELYLTCYYCNSSFPLTIAAKRLGITVIEMQHGVMENNHIPYGVWTKSPINGFKMMPNKVWNWDEVSKNMLADNFKSINITPFVGGNPWVDYFKNLDKLNIQNNFILYTLQPFIEFHILFTQDIINAINQLEYTWYMRLHPRQLDQKEDMIKYLKENGANLDKINFEEATQSPLPLLISNCAIHITQFSSCTIECVLLNKKTFLLHKEAKLYFNDYIRSGLAKYIEGTELLKNLKSIN